MNKTGERFCPGSGGVVELEHLHRYKFALKYALGKDVLDIACGEGYGCRLLAEIANKVVGVDLDADAIRHAKNAYRDDNIDFHVGDCIKIPLPDQSIDLVTSFETIEHHNQHQEMMLELKRIMKPDGILIISTPNRIYFEQIKAEPNPYHVRELSKDQLSSLLSQNFQNFEIFEQKVVFGSLINQKEYGVLHEPCLEMLCDDFVGGSPYSVAFASDSLLPKLHTSFLEADVVRHDLVQRLLEENTQMRTRLKRKPLNRVKRFFGLQQ